MTFQPHDVAAEPRDHRGLMRLDAARALLASVSTFEKGAPIAETSLLESDRVWAALMSLESVEEFVDVASRIDFRFHPRRPHSLMPLERYGEGILPWLRTFVRDGVLINVPWCVAPCLSAIEAREAFELLYSVRAVQSEPDEPVALPVEPNDDADALVIDWLWAHPALGFPWVAEKAAAGDARARLFLKSLAQTAPTEVFGYVRDAMGEEQARRIFALSEAPVELDVRAVLTTLDAGTMLENTWPVFHGEPVYHALRMVAARATTGDAWAVAFERVEGHTDHDAMVRTFVHGIPIGHGWIDERPLNVFVDVDETTDEVVVAVGPRGPLEIPPVEGEDEAAREIRAIRAYLQRYPESFREDARTLAGRLGIGDDFLIIADTSAYEHVIGEREDAPAQEQRWCVLPSSSAVFQSLAEAIVARDPSRFAAGPSNLTSER